MLIIEDDEWTSTLLTRSLAEAGYQAEVVREARIGLDRARTIVPDCIICDAVLPDIDGFWVARRLRSEPDPIGKIPLVFLSSAADAQTRQHSLEMGADLFIAKPFRSEDVVGQVGALLVMAQRLRQQPLPQRDSLFDPPTSSRLGPAVFRADLAQFSVSTTLTMLEMERRTGSLRVKTDQHEARVDIVEGALFRVWLDGRLSDPVTALRMALGWQSGRFSFETTKLAAPPGSARHSISGVLLDAMRLEDEAAKPPRPRKK